MRNLTTLILVGGTGAMLALTGCQMINHHTEETSGRTAGRVFDDKTITQSVEHDLKTDQLYKYNNVDVKTYDGVVQLSGFVSTDAQKDRAAQIAQRVDGVRQVQNNISLMPAGAPSGNLAPTGRDNYNENRDYNNPPPPNNNNNQPHP